MEEIEKKYREQTAEVEYCRQKIVELIKRVDDIKLLEFTYDLLISFEKKRGA